MYGHRRPHITRIPPVWVIFVTLLLTYGYFFSEPSWNGRSRMDLVRALVEDHTTQIDRFHANTGDKSYFEGHYYSDKAPGASFLAVPTYAAYFGWLTARVGESAARNQADEFEYKGLYLSTLAAVAFPSAAAVTLFFVVATRLVENRTKARATSGVANAA